MVLTSSLLLVSTAPVVIDSNASAQPCYPSDPTGNNPQNPCLVYPPPGVNPNTFIEGTGRPVRESPTVQHPDGKVILTPSGFWTGINTSGQTRVIKDSNSNIFTLPK
jgi:hypothetical protein